MRQCCKYFLVVLPLLIFTSSFFFEHYLHFKPCNLCIIERYSYFSLFATLCVKYGRIVSLLLGLGISIYHKLVQFGYFSTCHFFGNYNNQEDFADAVQNAVPCTAQMSLAGIDAVWFNIAFFGIYLTIFSIPKLRKFFFN